MIYIIYVYHIITIICNMYIAVPRLLLSTVCTYVVQCFWYDMPCYMILFVLFIDYNTITIYIPIIYELSTFDHVLGIVSQTTVAAWNRTHDPYTNSLVER